MTIDRKTLQLAVALAVAACLIALASSLFGGKRSSGPVPQMGKKPHQTGYAGRGLDADGQGGQVKFDR